MKPSLECPVIKGSMPANAKEGEVAGGQQVSAFICDFHIGLTGAAASMTDYCPGGHGAAAGGTDEIQTAVQGDVVSSIGAAGGSTGAVSHSVVSAAMQQTIRIQTIRAQGEHGLSMVGSGRTGSNAVKNGKSVGQ